MFNVWETGAVIAYLHDLTDITVSMVKTVSETEFKLTTVAVFVIHMFMWFYVRLLIFPYCIYKIKVTDIDFGHWCIKPIYMYLLSCLFLLHIYWFQLFVRVLVHYASSNSTEDV